MSYTEFPNRTSRRRSGASQAESSNNSRRSSQARSQEGEYVLPDGMDNTLPSAHVAPRRRPTATDSPLPLSQNNLTVGTPRETRRGSGGSESTLAEEDNEIDFESYRHTYDIPPPPQAAGGHIISHPRPDYRPPPIPVPEDLRREYEEDERAYHEENAATESNYVPSDERRRGLFANILRLHGLDLFDEDDEEGKEVVNTFGGEANQVRRPWGFRRMDSVAMSEADVVLDPEDPTVSGPRKASHEDAEDTEKSVLRDMNYHERRKEKRRMRIEFNVTSVYNRQMFLIKLG
ncbi:hypothetical protein QCA50_000063 [Cerrena zonata]|uniref:Uncharacterized protein n=1 Tax=Cerrena zonata TaxID=2478898 RepID=A0AAW0GYB2_9APHY